MAIYKEFLRKDTATIKHAQANSPDAAACIDTNSTGADFIAFGGTKVGRTRSIMRWKPNINVPTNGIIINSGNISLVSYDSAVVIDGSGAFTAGIEAYNGSIGNLLCSENNYTGSWSGTGSTDTWALQANLTDFVRYISDDISVILQEWFDRANYTKLDELGIRFDEGDASAGEYKLFYASHPDIDKIYYPQLIIDYTIKHTNLREEIFRRTIILNGH